MPRKSMKDTGIEDFGKRLRQIRKSRNWTQVELARKIGVERPIIGNYELGLHYPTIPTLVKLSEVLGVTTDRLLGLAEAKALDIQDRRLHHLFLELDRADFGTQGVVKQVIESLLVTSRLPKPRTGTEG